jgi:uncharacterized protein YlxW (UPF0749 family)
MLNYGLGNFFSWQLAAWATFCLNVVAIFKIRNERLRDTANEKSGDWSRLRDEIKRLDERCDHLLTRCDHLQSEVDACREREGEWMSRAISAEAALLGEGEARQTAQRIVSADRQESATRKDKGNG